MKTGSGLFSRLLLVSPCCARGEAMAAADARPYTPMARAFSDTATNLEFGRRFAVTTCALFLFFRFCAAVGPVVHMPSQCGTLDRCCLSSPPGMSPTQQRSRGAISLWFPNKLKFGKTRPSLVAVFVFARCTCTTVG